MTTKSALELMILTMEHQAAEHEKSAQASFKSMNDQLYNLRNNGEFADAPVIALSAAARFMQAYAKDASERLAAADQLRTQAGTLRAALAMDED